LIVGNKKQNGKFKMNEEQLKVLGEDLYFLNKLAKNTIYSLSSRIYSLKNYIISEYGTPTGKWHEFIDGGCGHLIELGGHTFHDFHEKLPEDVTCCDTVCPPRTSDSFIERYNNLFLTLHKEAYFAKELNLAKEDAAYELNNDLELKLDELKSMDEEDGEEEFGGYEEWQNAITDLEEEIDFNNNFVAEDLAVFKFWGIKDPRGSELSEEHINYIFRPKIDEKIIDLLDAKIEKLENLLKNVA
jgi:hypothetical protein